MPAVQTLSPIESNTPGIHVVRVQADDAETYQSPFPIGAAFVQANRADAASDSVTVTYTYGATLITFELVGTTTGVNCSLLIIKA